MKVYLSFDIEGVSGITDAIDIDPASTRFSEAMILSTQDVNAAVEGALAAGATEIIVNDGHGRDRRSLLFSELHPKAKLLRGRVTTAWLNMAEFDETYDAVFFIGWHARPSSPGILSHCFNSRAFTAWRVNGTLVGEPEFAAALAGHYNIPLVLFTGDDCSCQEVKKWHPECECIATKQAIDRYSAICLPKELTYALIKEGAERALRRKDEIKPFNFKMPLRVEADVLDDHIARTIALIPGVKQISPLSIAYESDNYLETFSTIHAITLLSIAVT